MNYCHLIYTPFTGLGLANGFRGQEWYEHRIGIFKKYVVPNLLNQTSQDFIHWISFRPEEKENPLTIELEKHLKKIGYKFIFTFDGLMYWDDKVPNDDLLPRLEKTLPQLKHLVEGKEYVYLTHLDSDDMISNKTIGFIQKHGFKKHRAFIHSHGYALNGVTGQVVEWNSPCPSSYTLMYPADVFIDPQKHIDYISIYKGKNHFDIPKVYDPIVIPHPYCATIHGGNISTIWGHNFRGEEVLYENVKEELSKEFGFYVNPIPPHRKHLIEILKQFEPESVLELGSGWGNNLLLIKKEFPNATVVGTDIDKKRLEYSMQEIRKSGLDIELIKQDVREMGFLSNSYDVVLSCALLLMLDMDIETIQQIINNMAKTAKKAVVLVEFHDESLGLKTSGKERVVRNYIPLLNNAGFTNIEKIKIAPEYFDSPIWQKFGYYIIAKK